jgi:predicted Zn-dependent protease
MMKKTALIVAFIAIIATIPFLIWNIPVDSKQQNGIKIFKPKVEERNVFITVMGKIDSSTVEEIKENLENFYAAKVSILPPTKILTETKVKNLNKYDASEILKIIKKTHKDKKGKILMLTSLDISVKERELNGVVYKNWGVWGLGGMNGRACIVSNFRMGKNRSDRFVNTAIHEIGHTLNIPHCEADVKCLMNDAKGRAMDYENNFMCESCRKKISWKVQ